MKRFITSLLSLSVAFSMVTGAAVTANAEEAGDITLDVIICQYGPNTNDWFLGTGMDGSNFVEKFETESKSIIIVGNK